MPLITLTVALAALVLTILMAVKEAKRRRYWATCAGFMVAGLACWLAFAAIGSEIDEQGILREPFVLLPTGGLLIGLGMIGGLIRALVSMCSRAS
ncbi:DUF3955 domain-containing protein [Paludibacterium sp.]|uniref:DUF3955 domain-containing protein n=1 Tax=Paludibacterium sp. TaxID=1917523 RepID=UPI0025CED168|nr:DUF3955 domain-containing protein [Paludibacterium sp.]